MKEGLSVDFNRTLISDACEFKSMINYYPWKISSMVVTKSYNHTGIQF